jgi:hypothetical protein
MNARAILTKYRTIEENSGGTVDVRETQDNFEIVLEILKCARSTKTVVA